MNTRTFVLAALIFFSLAPTAFAQTGGASGSWGTAPTSCPPGCSIGALSGQCVDSSGNLCSAPSGGSPGTPPSGIGGSPGAPPAPGQNVTLINPLQGGGTLESFLNNILAFVIRIGTIVVILMLVFVGFKFVTARGEPAKITEARSALLWTVVGALILLGAQAIAIAITATVKALSVGG